MNSVIIHAVCTFCVGFADTFKKSGIYKIFMRIYNAFSAWWRNSIILTFLRKTGGGNASEKSLLFKILYIPFAILDFIGKRSGKYIKRQLDESIILYWCRCYCRGALAINTRFYGGAMLAFVAAREIVTRSFSVYSLVAAVLGLLLLIFDFDVTHFFAGSKAVKFIETLTGFNDINWHFADKFSEKRRTTLILSVLSGIAIGIMSTKSLIGALALPVGVIGLTTVFVYPVSGVFFAALAAPFAPTIMLAALCLLTFAALVVKAVTTDGFKWKMDGVGVALGLFLVFMFASSLLSFAIAKSLTVWAMYLVFGGFYFVIINTMESKKQLYALLRGFTAIGVLVSIYGVLQYLFGWNTSNAWIDENMFEKATMRAYSTMENPNVLGEYLLILIPLSVVFMIRKGAVWLEKCFYAGVFLISVLCMVFTQSRGCWLGLILAACIFITFYNGKLWGLLPIVLVLLPFVMPQTMVDRMMSIGNMEDSSTSYRVFIWLGTIDLLKDFWLGGIGMGEGAFTKIYPLYSYNAIIAPHSHNTFLQLTVEGGICALLIFVVTMIIFIKKMSVVYIKKGKQSMDGMLALAISSSVIGFLLQSMFDYTFYNYRMMAMFFMLLAAGACLNLVGKEELCESN
ncbi:MAG: O-antigen ligase family protein [Firmicutes bacterium]|nr:O-antigen ligase family protein [Bacillota bacterium]